jgi:translation initiation factor 2 gamma subunit (eIF-2gamma)
MSIEHKVLIQVATERLKICDSCEHLFQPTKTCKKCGCFMLVKTKVPFVACPVHKWGKMDEENHGIPAPE